MAEGALHTFYLVVSSLLIAIPIGVSLGIIRYLKFPILSQVATVYIDVFRSSVMLVLICWCYYALPILIGVNLSAFSACSLAIGLQMSAFLAEIVRGGVQSIGRGQWEASRSLGLARSQILQYIIMPQAIHRSIPVLFLLLIELIKTTALAGIVTYPEIFYQSTIISSATYRPLETFTVVGVLYFTIIFFLSKLSRRLEVRYNRYFRS